MGVADRYTPDYWIALVTYNDQEGEDFAGVFSEEETAHEQARSLNLLNPNPHRTITIAPGYLEDREDL